MLPHDKALALSAVETEQLRDLRSRLNRLAGFAPAVAAKSIGPLTKGFFDLCARAGLDGGVAAGDEGAKSLAARADQASASELKAIVATLGQMHRGAPATWGEITAAGVLQAVISRRLALAGREPAKDSAGA